MSVPFEMLKRKNAQLREIAEALDGIALDDLTQAETKIFNVLRRANVVGVDATDKETHRCKISVNVQGNYTT